MLPNIDLPFFPSTTNCLAWSREGELAIAAGDYVRILVPNRRHRKFIPAEPNFDPWIHVHLRVNVFSQREWRFEEPDSFENFSLGEEQSQSHVVSVAWSPSGVAKHERCALAVLTSNLLLSIWVPTKDPAVVTSWKRVLIVNHALGNYFTAIEPEGDVRKRKRIRAMAWADMLPNKTEMMDNDQRSVCLARLKAIESDPTSCLFNYEAFLPIAIINDECETVLLRVLFPGCGRKFGDSWEARVLERLIPHQSQIPSSPASDHTANSQSPDLDGAKQSKEHASTILQRLEVSLAFSQWRHQGNRDGVPEAILACQTHESITFFALRGMVPQVRPLISEDFTEFGITHVSSIRQIADGDGHHGLRNGPMVWHDRRNDDVNEADWTIAIGDTVLSLADDIFEPIAQHVEMEIDSETCISSKVKIWRKAHDGKGSPTSQPWDEMSGICLLRVADLKALRKSPAPEEGEARFRAEITQCEGHKGVNALLCTVTYLSDLNIFRSSRTDPLLGDNTKLKRVTGPSMLEEKLSSCRQKFSDNHQLGGRVTMKTWGLCAHEGIIATCITVHPSETIEYTTAAAETTTLVFSHALLEAEPLREENEIVFNFPWEKKTNVTVPELAYVKVWDAISQAVGLEQVRKSAASRRILYTMLCASLIWQNISHGAIHYARSILVQWWKSSENFTEDEFGSLNLLSDAPIDLEQLIRWINAEITSKSISEQSQSLSSCLEYCQIPACSSPLFWKNLKTARCSNGHEMTRCTLTFLAIQEPGISKYCEYCNKEYINEDSIDQSEYIPLPLLEEAELTRGENPVSKAPIAEEDRNDPNESYAGFNGQAHMGQRRITRTLAHTLFARFPNCIFCFGKFIVP